MGSTSDMCDLERFMRSEAGKAAMKETVDWLKGRTIVDVQFSNKIEFIATTLLLDDGGTFFVLRPLFNVAVIRENYSEVLLEEYYQDYPDRRPKEEKTDG